MSVSEDRDVYPHCSINRRQFLGLSTCILVAGTSVLTASGITNAQNVTSQIWSSPSNGSRDPYPIPWLDKNGSHNQSPAPDTEPSSIYHFKGQIARCNNFKGMGTDNRGNRIAFGAPSTDFSFMKGEYFAARVSQMGIFSHI